jgi:hypothetical protein
MRYFIASLESIYLLVPLDPPLDPELLPDPELDLEGAELPELEGVEYVLLPELAGAEYVLPPEPEGAV